MEYSRKISKYYSKLLKAQKLDPDFFEFVRRIEQDFGSDVVGTSSEFKKEPFRFGQVPYLNFPQTAISEISERDRLFVFVYFFGLGGVNGPLPLELTSYVFQRSYNYYDLSMRRFHDIINHRFIGLFYRAWKMNEKAVNSDSSSNELITSVIKGLSGAPSTKTSLPKDIDAFCSNISGNLIKSRDGLEGILRSFFKIPVTIVDKIISICDIPEDYHCKLGNKSTAILGASIQLGSRFYSNSKKFIIKIGPTSFSEANFMLPDMQGFEDVTNLVNSYLDRPLEYDLLFELYTKSLPEPRLNGSLQLGRNIWLDGNKNKITNLKIGASRLAETLHMKSYQVKEL